MRSGAPQECVASRNYRLWVASDQLETAQSLGLLETRGADALYSAGSAVPGGRGPNRLIDSPLPGGPLRFRPARHGGWLAHLLGDRFLSPRRVRREFASWTALASRQVPIARPVFAFSRRRGLIWRSALATRERPGATDLTRWLSQNPGANDLVTAGEAVAAALRRFHDAGAIHGDLNAKNILIEPDPSPHSHPQSRGAAYSCYLIDFDRTQMGQMPTPAQRARDWMRLSRSIEKWGHAERIDPRTKARVLRRYCEGDRALRAALMTAARSRQARFSLHRLSWRIGRALGRSALAVALLAVSLACSQQQEKPCPSAGAGTSEAAPRLSLLAVGDTGRTRPFPDLFEGARSVAGAMTDEARQRSVEGLVLLGDNFYWKGLEREHATEQIATHLIEPFCFFMRLEGTRSAEVNASCSVPREHRRPVPVYAVLGNHDLETPESPHLQRDLIPEYIPDWIMAEGLSKTIEVGEGISLILFESEPAINDRAAIISALGQSIREAKGPWRILATHRPIATDDHAAVQVGGYPAFVLDAIREAGRPVQLVLAAHHHNLQVFALGAPTPLLHVGVGAGSRAEPPVAKDHPDSLFARIGLGFTRIDLVGSGESEVLRATLFSAPRWPILRSIFPARPLARYEVDARGDVSEVESFSSQASPRRRHP